MDHYVQAVSLRWYNACAWYAVTLAAALAGRGVRVTVVGDAGTPALVRAAESHGLDTVEGLRPSAGGVTGITGRIGVYREFARCSGITAVNAHTGMDHLLWALALRGTGIPIIRTYGNQIPPKNHLAARWLISRKTAGIIATCLPVRGFFADRFGIDPGAIPVINGGIGGEFLTAPPDRVEARRELGIPGDGLLFGILARFSPDKGHRHFFDAAGMFARRHPSARFMVAGWDAQLTGADMRRMAGEAGIAERTVFPGKRLDSRELIAALDVGIIASVRSETVCRIAMEYMATGVPVIATDTNVIPEVVRHGESGLVVRAGDAEAMAAAMEEMASSEATRREFGAKGRRIVENEYTLDAFAERTLDAYRSMM